MHERRSGTFLEYLSDVGGLRDTVTLIISPIIASWSALSYSLSITNDMPASIMSNEAKKLSQHLQLISGK